MLPLKTPSAHSIKSVKTAHPTTTPKNRSMAKTPMLNAASRKSTRSPLVNADEMLSDRDVRMKLEPSVMKTLVRKTTESVSTAMTVPKTPGGRTIKLRAQQKTQMQHPQARTLLKSIEYMDYPEFLDKHYNQIEPGIHKIEYTMAEYRTVIQDANLLLSSEKTLIDVDPPVIIVGDIHGQFNDLINMFLLIGRPPEKRYLFLGDYVDRGMMSIECIMLLLAYKVCYPSSVYLLRGNHECARVNRKYGFWNECLMHLGENGETIWAMFQRCFNNLPVSALVATKILCMHGGLSPSLDSLDDVRNTSKPVRNPFRGVINDMLWADPDLNILDWRTSSRGSGFAFGSHVIDDFCERFGVELIVRAHQMCLDGFWVTPNRKLLTLFSAPMYCNLYRNAGTVLEVDDQLHCKLISMMPESRGCRERVTKQNRLWDETVDYIFERLV
uniref:Serine/threonine-protein phosphatase n=1 Tax=Haemonchus contortus TaxID=6289 RepID=A0A7I4YQ22_HAECO